MTANQAEPASVATGYGRFIVWALATVGVFAIIAVVILTFGLTVWMPAREPAPVTAGQGEGQEEFDVGGVRTVPGTSLFAVNINVGQSKNGSSYSDATLRNVLLLDRTTGASRRILPDNRQLVRDVAFLPAKGVPQPGGTAFNDAVSVVAEAAGAPANDDAAAAYYVLQIEQAVGGRSRLKLMVGRLANGEQDTVMTGLDGIDEYWMIDDRQLGLLVREERALYYRVVDMQTLKVTKSMKIEIG